MEDNTVFLDLNLFVHDSVEKNIVDSMFKTEFYKKVNEYGMKLDELFINNRKSNKSMMEPFNFMLKKFKKDYLFDISDMLVCIEQDFANLFIILNLLDEETKFLLKEELCENYDLKLKKNLLSAFMVE